MVRFEHHADALRLQHFLNGIGNLRRHLFLNLQPLGVDFYHARQFEIPTTRPVGT